MRLGPYQVVLDGVRQDLPGFQSGDNQVFDAVLFNSTGLRRTTHQIEIINTGADSSRPVLDISRVSPASALPISGHSSHG